MNEKKVPNFWGGIKDAIMDAKDSAVDQVLSKLDSSLLHTHLLILIEKGGERGYSLNELVSMLHQMDQTSPQNEEPTDTLFIIPYIMKLREEGKVVWPEPFSDDTRIKAIQYVTDKRPTDSNP